MIRRALPLTCALILSVAPALSAELEQQSGAMPREAAVAPRSAIVISSNAAVSPSIVIDDRERIHLVWLEEHQQGREIRYTSAASTDQHFRPAVTVNGADE